MIPQLTRRQPRNILVKLLMMLAGCAALYGIISIAVSVFLAVSLPLFPETWEQLADNPNHADSTIVAVGEALHDGPTFLVALLIAWAFTNWQRAALVAAVVSAVI